MPDAWASSSRSLIPLAYMTRSASCVVLSCSVKSLKFLLSGPPFASRVSCWAGEQLLSTCTPPFHLRRHRAVTRGVGLLGDDDQMGDPVQKNHRFSCELNERIDTHVSRP